LPENLSAPARWLKGIVLFDKFDSTKGVIH
jgi:hypothetical protein